MQGAATLNRFDLRLVSPYAEQTRGMKIRRGTLDLEPRLACGVVIPLEIDRAIRLAGDLPQQFFAVFHFVPIRFVQADDDAFFHLAQFFQQRKFAFALARLYR